MSIGSVLDLSEDLVVSPRPTLVSRRVDDAREPLIFDAHKAALQGRFIQRDGSTFLWFTFPKAHVFIPLAQAHDPSLSSRVLEILERKGTVPTAGDSAIAPQFEDDDFGDDEAVDDEVEAIIGFSSR